MGDERSAISHQASSAAVADSPVLVHLDDVEVVFQTRKGLFKSGEVRALNGVSLDVARGETVALVGESGSGKTTLGRVSVRLVKATSGTVRYDGRDITHIPDHELGWFRQRAQIVFQDPFSSLNPYMRVRDLIEEPLVIDGVARSERWDRIARALDAVELVPVARFAEKYPTMMSGGQRQRVGIARALVRDPEFVVADEPVSMIDASSRIEILDLLRGLQESRGVSFLYITHDIASARHFADRIAVMYLGTIVEHAERDELYARPQHPYTHALLSAVPVPDPRVERERRPILLRGGIPSAAEPPSGCRFHTRCPVARLPGPCDAEVPVLRDLAGGHLAACHFPGQPARPAV